MKVLSILLILKIIWCNFDEYYSNYHQVHWFPHYMWYQKKVEMWVKMIRWESDWWLYHNRTHRSTLQSEAHSALIKCFSESLALVHYLVHYDPVLLDLCYLQEPYVILCVWKLLQLSLSPPQIIDLLLQSLQSFFSSTHCSLFLISDPLCRLRAASLNGADELSEDPLAVLHCCVCRALLGHTSQSHSELQWVLTETSQTSLLLQTHLMRLYSLSQLLKIFLSLLDPLLERPLRLLQLLLQHKPITEMHFTLSLYHHEKSWIQWQEN